MSREDVSDDKTLIDRSVQTSPALDMDPQQSIDEVNQDLSSISKVLEGLTLSEQFFDGVSVEDELADTLPSIKSASRILKRMHLPERRPSSVGPTSTTTSARIVSLPETVSEYSEKKVLRRTVKKRVVSMPVRSEHAITTNVDNSLESEAPVENILPGNERPSRIRVCSNLTDTPRTPSPPSSPDSIVIIGKNSDDDWINWAGSPPKPIPALHGPSSLPYARCPSGAEGTVIEGQENLTRMIWGLDGEDSGRARPEAPDGPSNPPIASPTPQPPSKNSFNPAQGTVPPRFNKVTPQLHTESRPALSTQNTQIMFPPDSSHQHPVSDHNNVFSSAEYEYVVPAHGPIDLNLLARPRSSTGLTPVYGDLGSPNNCAYSIADPRADSYPEDSDVDWQNYLLAQDSIRSSMLSAQGFVHGGMNDYLQSSGSYHSVSPPVATHSPVVLDSQPQLGHLGRTSRHPSSMTVPRGTPLHTPSMAYSPSRRMSALEIAQKYRQQQLFYTQSSSMLPTPPSSTSPMWSSSFSPYQESLWSPDVRGTSLWSSASFSAPPSQDRLLSSQSIGSLAARTQGHLVASGATGLNGYQKPPLLAGMDRSTRPASDRAFSTNGVDLALVNTTRSLNPTNRRSNIHVSAVADPHTSPVAPRPPPNTPLQSHATKRQGVHASNIPSAALFTPLSPTSPDQSAFNVIGQHPRSIPLNRLIQRRLSSVPEEGAPSLMKRQTRLSPSPTRLPPRFSSVIERTANGGYRVLGPRFNQRGSGFSLEDKGHTPVAKTTLTQQPPKAAPVVSKPPVKQGRPQNLTARGRQHTDGGSTVVRQVEQPQKSRNRGRCARRGRLQSASVASGPERVDGGLTVRS